MTRSEAKRKVQILVDRIEREHGSICWLSIISEKGKVNFIVVNSIDGGSKSVAKREIRDWAKKNKVKLKWLESNPKKSSKTKKHNPICKTGMRTQTLIFDRAKWTVAKARKWLRDHGYKVPKVDTTDRYHRFRQEPTSHFKRNSFRTKAFGKNTGIKTVLGCPLKKWA